MDYYERVMDPRRVDPLTELMVRYQGGDQTAFEELYRRTLAQVEGHVGRWASSGRGDLVQETYLQVHRARRTYRPDLPFWPWILSIARHVALSDLRSRGRRREREVAVERYPELQADALVPDVLQRERLEEALSRLPASQRRVLWLSRVEGMSSVEIARVTGGSSGAIKVRLHRVTRKLRAWMDGAKPGVKGSGGVE